MIVDGVEGWWYTFTELEGDKHCEVDPVPTWLIKEYRHLLAPVLAALCNATFSTDRFSRYHKPVMSNLGHNLP